MVKKIKTKKRYNKKIKISKDRIGRDLVQDKIGTNQILDYNELISYTYKPDIRFDLPSYNKYVDNFNEQKINQQYGGDPNEQYQLKKMSKQLYRNLRDSLFNEGIFREQDTTINLDEVSVIQPNNYTNSWDAIPGGTATSIGGSSSIVDVEPIGGSSSIVDVEPIGFIEEATPVIDQSLYIYEELYKKIINKDDYRNKFPSETSYNRWKAPIAKYLKAGGPDFSKKYDDVFKQVYIDIYPNNKKIIPPDVILKKKGPKKIIKPDPKKIIPPDVILKKPGPKKIIPPDVILKKPGSKLKKFIKK
jgi:hypothetical protein